MNRSVSLLIVLAAYVGGSTPAIACLDVDAEIRDLTRQQRFVEAEKLAARKLTVTPDALGAHLALAHVYVKWAMRPEVTVDTEVLGFAPGETGTRTISEDQLSAFRSVVRLDPERARKAEEALETTLRRWPEHAPAHRCLLELHRTSGNHSALLSSLRRAAADLRSTGAMAVDMLIGFGSSYYKQGSYAEAAEVLSALLEEFPGSAPVLSSLGVVQIEFEELRKAIGLLRRARSLAPDDMLVVRNLASVSMYLGELDEAASALETLYATQPDQTRLLFEHAVVAAASEPSKASAAWRRYLDRHSVVPDDPSWAAFAAAQLEAPTNDESALAMARSLADAQGSLALALLHGIAKRRPRDPSVPFFMAQTFERERLPKHALAALERAESLLGDDEALAVIPRESLWLEAGRLSVAQKRYAEGIRYLELVEGADPERKHLQYMLGLAHSGAGNDEQAFQYFQRCLETANNAEYAEYCRRNLQSGSAPASAPD